MQFFTNDLFSNLQDIPEPLQRATLAYLTDADFERLCILVFDVLQEPGVGDQTSVVREEGKTKVHFLKKILTYEAIKRGGSFLAYCSNSDLLENQDVANILSETEQIENALAALAQVDLKTKEKLRDFGNQYAKYAIGPNLEKIFEKTPPVCLYFADQHNIESVCTVFFNTYTSSEPSYRFIKPLYRFYSTSELQTRIDHSLQQMTFYFSYSQKIGHPIDQESWTTLQFLIHRMKPTQRKALIDNLKNELQKNRQQIASAVFPDNFTMQENFYEMITAFISSHAVHLYKQVAAYTAEKNDNVLNFFKELSKHKTLIANGMIDGLLNIKVENLDENFIRSRLQLIYQINDLKQLATPERCHQLAAWFLILTKTSIFFGSFENRDIFKRIKPHFTPGIQRSFTLSFEQIKQDVTLPSDVKSFLCASFVEVYPELMSRNEALSWVRAFFDTISKMVKDDYGSLFKVPAYTEEIFRLMRRLASQLPHSMIKDKITFVIKRILKYFMHNQYYDSQNSSDIFCDLKPPNQMLNLAKKSYKIIMEMHNYFDHEEIRPLASQAVQKLKVPQSYNDTLFMVTLSVCQTLNNLDQLELTDLAYEKIKDKMNNSFFEYNTCLSLFEFVVSSIPASLLENHKKLYELFLPYIFTTEKHRPLGFNPLISQKVFASYILNLWYKKGQQTPEATADFLKTHGLTPEAQQSKAVSEVLEMILLQLLVQERIKFDFEDTLNKWITTPHKVKMFMLFHEMYSNCKYHIHSNRYAPDINISEYNNNDEVNEELTEETVGTVTTNLSRMGTI